VTTIPPKDFSYSPDKVALLREALLSVWKGDRVDALLAAIAENQQEFEDAAFGIYTGLFVETATGYFLDLWGAIYDEAREDMTDTEYRIVVLTKAYVRRASGNVEDSKYVAEVLTNGRATISPQFPASYQVTIDVGLVPLSDQTRSRIRRILDYVRPAGVGATYVEVTSNGFLFDSGALDSDGLARVL
jgi:hypothetical protein